MFSTSEFYSYCRAHDVDIIPFDRLPAEATTVRYHNAYAVGLNFLKLKTVRQMRTAMLHESGHLHTGALHKVDSPFQLVAQNEHRADADAFRRHLPPDTYIIGLDTKPITLKKYETMWQRFWRKYGVGEEVVHTKRVYRRGRSEVVKYSTWRVPVCGHQFRHEYVCMLAMAGVPEEIAIQLVGHANAKMIHEVYMALKPQMLEDARKRLDALL